MYTGPLKFGCARINQIVFSFLSLWLKEDAMKIIEAFWSKSVTVRLRNGLEHTFHSVDDAVDFLENEWPTRFGTHHRRALDLCRAAQRRMTSAEAAREAFISACLEACMPLILQPTQKPERPTSADLASIAELRTAMGGANLSI